MRVGDQFGLQLVLSCRYLVIDRELGNVSKRDNFFLSFKILNSDYQKEFRLIVEWGGELLSIFGALGFKFG